VGRIAQDALKEGPAQNEWGPYKKIGGKDDAIEKGLGGGVGSGIPSSSRNVSERGLSIYLKNEVAVW